MSHVEKYGSFRLRGITLQYPADKDIGIVMRYPSDKETGIVIRGEEYYHDIWFAAIIYEYHTKICFEI